MLSSLRRRAVNLITDTPLEGPARRLTGRRRVGASEESWLEATGRRYDEWTIEIMERVLVKDSNCVDVGAAEGAFTREFLRLAPEGAHVAIEPLPQFARLVRERFPSVVVHECALSDARGTDSFWHVVSDPAWSGLRPDDYQRDHLAPPERTEWIDVEVQRLDDLLPPDRPVRLVKVDVNGGELGMFRGGLGTLRRWKPFVVFEHGAAAQYYGASHRAVYEFLVNDVGLSVSLLDGWLAGRDPMGLDGFLHELDRGAFYFLAHP